MATKNVILIIVAAYCLMWAVTSRALGRDEEDEKMKSLWWMVGMFWPFVWAVTSRALGRDEEDEKMKSLWWMVGMFWPFVWAVCIIGLIAYLFGNEKKRKIKHF